MRDLRRAFARERYVAGKINDTCLAAKMARSDATIVVSDARLLLCVPQTSDIVDSAMACVEARRAVSLITFTVF